MIAEMGRGGDVTLLVRRPAPGFEHLTAVGWRGTVVRGIGGKGAWAMVGYASGGKSAITASATGKLFGRPAGLALAVGLSVIILGLVPARAANWLEKNFWLSGPRYDRQMPACDYPAALDRIIGNFRTKEFGFWNSELRIVGFEDIRENAELPWAAQSIPRRFCSATAVINDGAKHPIYYSISEDTGMIGMDWGVNFCVAGLDRDWSYNPACRAARP